MNNSNSIGQDSKGPVEEHRPIKGVLYLHIEHMDAFQELYQGLKQKNRFVPTPNAQRLVAELLDFGRSHRSARITAGSGFFRARVNPTQTLADPRPLPRTQMSAPPSERAGAGRLNPEGMPYLYLASDPYTAVAEVRPWVGAQVTVARVKINRDIEIIDFTNETPVGRFPGANFPWSESGAETIWRELLSYAISIPLQPNHSVNYVPTQYFAEVLKANGVGGIKYKSSLNPKGFNLTIFDPFVGQVTSTRLIAVSGVTYKYEPAKRRLARKPKETKGAGLDTGQI